MSGHSKWSTIKRQKGAADTKRGATFTKLANALTLAVKQGGGITDPESNFKLRLSIEKARSLNMPKDNIERAIERGLGKSDKGDLTEVVYEGFGPGGVALIVEATTDNKLRTNSEVKSVFDKNGGSLATPGAVTYQFQTKGQIIVKRGEKSFDEIFLIAVDAGAQDLEESSGDVFIYTKSEELAKVKDALVAAGIVVTEYELIRKPLTFVTIQDTPTAKKLITFVEKIEDHDDVSKVYMNADINERVVGSL